MDLNIFDCNDLNDYISVNHCDFDDKYVDFTMSTLLFLKMVRSFEIDYYQSQGKSGVAFVIFEQLLRRPPSNVWFVFGHELISLLRFWMIALKKRLLRQSCQWWGFLKSLLKFTKEIGQKHKTLPNTLVQQTVEPLLELAVDESLDAHQKYEILHCLNFYCVHSTREVRFALRRKLQYYFINLSHIMATCGYLPTQYCILETLLRWLLPRCDDSVRLDAANMWFSENLYNNIAINIFLKRRWQNFSQDARLFLNAVNFKKSSVMSVVCKKLTVGNTKILSGSGAHQLYWIDINVATNCLTVVMDPKELRALGVTNHSSYEVFTITEENTQMAKIIRKGLQIVIQVKTISSPQLYPSSHLLDGCGCVVNFTISSQSDFNDVNIALWKTFGNKYRKEKSRFSRAERIRNRRKCAGYFARHKTFTQWKSRFTSTRSHRDLQRMSKTPGSVINDMDILSDTDNRVDSLSENISEKASDTVKNITKEMTMSDPLNNNMIKIIENIQVNELSNSSTVENIQAVEKTLHNTDDCPRSPVVSFVTVRKKKLAVQPSDDVTVTNRDTSDENKDKTIKAKNESSSKSSDNFTIALQNKDFSVFDFTCEWDEDESVFEYTSEREESDIHRRLSATKVLDVDLIYNFPESKTIASMDRDKKQKKKEVGLESLKSYSISNDLRSRKRLLVMNDINAKRTKVNEGPTEMNSKNFISESGSRNILDSKSESPDILNRKLNKLDAKLAKYLLDFKKESKETHNLMNLKLNEFDEKFSEFSLDLKKESHESRKMLEEKFNEWDKKLSQLVSSINKT